MRILLFLLLFFSSFLPGEEQVNILVSIPVYKKIVQELIGEKAVIHSVVPPGISFHTYEARPKDIEPAFSAVLWFYIGDPFEEKIKKALFSHQSTIELIDLREGVPLITQCSCHAGADPHIWLEPHLMKTQILTIANALKKKFPTESSDIDTRLQVLEKKIETLITQVDALLLPMKGRVIVIAHGAYAYLCKQYGLTQLSVEKEGKEPSLHTITQLLQQAKEAHVKKVFATKQFPKIGIERVASMLDAEVITLDPYSEEYFENMLTTVHQFHEAMNEESSH